MDVLRTSVADSAKMEDELKRVTPQLKVTVRANLRDWRMHTEQMQRMECELREQYAQLKPFMARTGEEIGQAMERIRTRESHLNVGAFGIFILLEGGGELMAIMINNDPI